MGCSVSMEENTTDMSRKPSPLRHKEGDATGAIKGTDDTRMNSGDKDGTKTGEGTGGKTDAAAPGVGTGGKAEGQPSGAGEKGETEKPPPKVYTEAEIDEMIDALLVGMKENLDKLAATSEWKDEEGYYTEAVRNVARLLSSSYFAMKKIVSPERNRRYRHQIGKVLLENGAIPAACSIVVSIYHEGWSKEDGKTDLKKWGPLLSCTLFLLNYSDDNEDFAIAMADEPNLMETMHEILVKSAPVYLDENDQLPVNREKMLKWALSIVHNSSKRESNTARLRSLNFMEALQPYLQGENKFYRLSAIASLAGIINEEESEVINANSDGVEFLLEVIRKGLKDPIRRHLGWSVEESAQTVRELARNDANKKLLVQCGVLELLVQMMQTGDVDEQREAAGSIWALAFDEDNQTKIVEDETLGVVGTLVEARNNADFKVRQAANGALWNCRKKLKKSAKYKDIGEQLGKSVGKGLVKKTATKDSSDEDDKTAGLGHIMISYQWSNQAVLKKIRDTLKAAGLNVWMDVDNMGGSTVQAMAEAVENAHLVLMCMSNKYKNSPNCRAEAEYSFQLRKTIVPLLMERGYKPDGWLGFILGAKLFYEFSDKYPFDMKMDSLLKVAQAEYGKKDTETIVPVRTTHLGTKPVVETLDETDAAPTSQLLQMSAPTARLVSKATLSRIRQWKKMDVSNWVNKNELPAPDFGHLTGGEVALLVAMKRESPDFFYKCLQDMLKVKDLLTLSRVVWALEDLID